MGYREPVGQAMPTAVITPGVTQTAVLERAAGVVRGEEVMPRAVQQQLAWQGQLLAAMGVDRWVSQSSPVLTLDNTIFDQVTFTTEAEQVVEPRPSSTAVMPTGDSHNVSPSLATASTDAVESLEQPVSPTALLPKSPVLPNNLVSQEAKSYIAPVVPNLGEDGASTFDISSSLVSRFGLQAIRVFNWVLLVDSQALQQDPRDAQLWSQLTINLKQLPAYFDFPLCDNEANLPNAALQSMATYKMAWASLHGFLHGLMHQSVNKALSDKSVIQTPRLGALTPLPECLESLSFERLPYLHEMVEDYRLKCQLWRLLTES